MGSLKGVDDLQRRNKTRSLGLDDEGFSSTHTESAARPLSVYLSWPAQLVVVLGVVREVNSRRLL